MALSLSNFLYPILALLLASIAQAATITYDWNITWVNANPDNAFVRPVIGINGQWPCPMIEVTKGDRVIVHIHNQLGNQSTSLHFHGLFQNGTTEMDGPVGVSQCAVPPGYSFTYNFTIDQPGTYWYHSHVKGQYTDGIRGQLVVHDPDSPYLGQYIKEYQVTLSDWYHEQMSTMLPAFISVKNPTGAEPVPEAALINDSQNVTFSVEPGKTYLFRMVNIGAFAGQYFWIEGHTMRIVEVDGVWTEAQEADMIYISVAQRYSFLVTARNDSSANFAMVGSMDQDLFDTVPDTLNPNVTAWLMYDDQKELAPATELDTFDPYDDFYLVPFSREELWTDVAHSIEMTMMMGNLADGANYAFINDQTYVTPKVPTLYSVLTSGNYATDSTIYGPNTNTFILQYGQVVEIILNNADSGKHPFHLHGHTFQAVVRSDEDAGYFQTPANATGPNDDDLPRIPMQRDTFMVRPHGNYVIRFRSYNPGIWLFHCHIEWHLASGLVATIIEDPLTLQNTIKIPQGHLDICAASNTPYAGNAAGNTVDLLDLSGVPRSPPLIPAGFTTRGYVAIVFSAISAVLGMAVIAWYGAAPISSEEPVSTKKIIEEAGIEPFVDEPVEGGASAAEAGSHRAL